MEPSASLSRSLSPPGVTGSSVTHWAHQCERCGERMDEVHCKIVCSNCGRTRDCSDP